RCCRLLSGLQSVPGIGQILALVILYEIQDITRFPRVQDFVSYCRLVKCAKESAGKRYGFSGKKIGNPQLKWAFLGSGDPLLTPEPPRQSVLRQAGTQTRQGQSADRARA